VKWRAALLVLTATSVARADARVAPSAKGVLGAWMVAGPFANGTVDDRKVALATAVAGKPWTLVSTGTVPSQDPGHEGSRSIDLKATLTDARAADIVAYAGGRLHIETAGRYYLLLGVDDGVRASVDGTVVLNRDEGRPLRDDDDIVSLDLAAGDHDVILKLHQRDGAWAFRARILNEAFEPPRGAYLELPGTTEDDTKTLAARMSWLIVDRAFSGGRYRPVVTVRYPEGVPLGVPLPVSTRLDGVPAGSTFDVRAGSAGLSDLFVALPPIEPWTGTATLESTVAGRVIRSTIIARPEAEQALVRMERALARVKGDEPWLLPGSIDSVRYLTRRLTRFIARGDQDTEALLEEARDIDRLAANLEKGVDPYDGRTGLMRRALVMPFDGAASEFGLYVPPGYKTDLREDVPRANLHAAKAGDGKKYPLVVGLHGMNSYSMSILRAMFGLDDEKKDAFWKDRHPVPVPPLDAFVIAPYAHGNTMYREIGEDDVLKVMQWAQKVFPIDDARITVTGPSMGGIGSASLPFHFPNVFAASEPLCGYHSYVIRADIAARPKRPWDKLLLEERSNVYWAENGEHLPLWIVHGTRDLPEANSGVLIDRYTKLGYAVKHDHPDAGHNVWGPTYADLKGLKWLLSAKPLDRRPSHVRFRTMRTRYATSAWVTVDELASEAGWGDVDARATSKSNIAVTTSGVAGLTLARDVVEGSVSVTIDGATLAFEENEPLVLHRTGSTWEKGAAKHEWPYKHGHVSGPIRDVFHEPLLVVYGAEEDARVNEHVARAFAEHMASYPVMSDIEFLARKEPLANDRALFLVGRANKVLAALGGSLPIRVEAGAVNVGTERMTGPELGAAFIHPNPVRPDRYVVVVAGADVPGTLRALALPELLPDFVVWDRGVTPARGQLLLGSATVRAGGFFKNDWSLPAVIADPLGKR
jgi:poly(3-hydroxybutyrate) depolymerase